MRYELEKGMIKTDKIGCGNNDWSIVAKVGDGICHDTTNNAECNFDGGDCCGTNVNIASGGCSECICYDDLPCDAPIELIGNGFCDDETNNQRCEFDGGDCCGECIKMDYCLNCVCYAPSAIDYSCKLYFFFNYVLISFYLPKSCFIILISYLEL